MTPTPKKPSEAQARVLKWLSIYPDVHIYRDSNAFSISPWWRNEYARRHMNGCIDILNGKQSGGLHPLAEKGSRAGGTPRITTTMFAVMAAQGWLKRVDARRWTVSENGARTSA